MDRNQDWSALAADWQQQDTPIIDVEAIREEAESRSRSLRRVIWLEVVFAVLVIVVCVQIALSPRSDTVETLLFGAMAAFLVVYQALMVWIRRRDLADAGRALGINPVGQSGVLFDRHFNDQAATYMRGEYVPMHLDAEAIKANSRSQLRLVP